jgi:hypothetical protein
VSYLDRKRERDRALIESIHGPLESSVEQLSEGGFDGGVRSDYMPRAEPRPLPPAGEPRELGWGEGVVLEGGAKLLFGDLDG